MRLIQFANPSAFGLFLIFMTSADLVSQITISGVNDDSARKTLILNR